MRHDRLAALASARHGVITVADARDLGVSRQALSQYARRHHWNRPWERVMLLPGAPNTFRQAAYAAAQIAGPRRVLVGRHSAAYLWGMTNRMPTTIEIVTVADWHDAELDGLRLPVTDAGRHRLLSVSVWRSRTLTRADEAEIQHIPLTSPARTVVDLAAVLSLQKLRAVVIDARQRGIVTLAEIDTVHRGISRYPGRPKVREVLRSLDEEDCDSELEWRFRKAARARGFAFFPKPFPFRCSDGVTIEIDVAAPEQWVAVECDGLSSRADRAQLATHHLRQNRAVADGWRPFLVDWTRLDSDAGRLFTELRELLATPHPHPGPAPKAATEAVDPRFRARRRR